MIVAGQDLHLVLVVACNNLQYVVEDFQAQCNQSRLLLCAKQGGRDTWLDHYEQGKYLLSVAQAVAVLFALIAAVLAHFE